MKQKLTLAIAMGSISLLAAQAFSAEADNAAYRQGYGLVLDQRWIEARDYFEKFQADYTNSAWADDAAFWQCYAIEQAASQDSEHFTCYENFLNSWPDSSWVSDARSKLLVLGSRLASRGNPQYMERLRFSGDGDAGFDFEFDFDGDAIADSVAEAMDRAQEELERVRLINNNIVLPGLPELPELPDLSEVMDAAEIRRVVEEARVRVEESRRVAERTRREVVRRSRNSADDELLTVLAALRNNERASEILIDRFDSSTDPELRARIVLLLEEFRGEQITNKLIEIVNNDAAENVRNNAVVVLLDRREPASRNLLLGIALDSAYPTAIRGEILEDLDRWDDQAQAINTLRTVLNSETDARLIRITADTLADIGNDAAIEVLMSSFTSISVPENRNRVLAEIADIDSPQVLNFLSETALNNDDDEAAAVAIAGIADHENNIAVAALEHIYLNTNNPQRRMAAIHGIGKSETTQAVEVLRQVLASETDAAITTTAVRALGETNQAAAVEIVLYVYRSNSDEAVQRAAIRALRQLEDHPGATDGLLEILEDRLATQSAQ